MKKLTLEDRRKIEKMWGKNASPAEIASELKICQATVYVELKRGDTGELDKNFRPGYNAERGQTVYLANLRNRGRRKSEN